MHREDLATLQKHFLCLNILLFSILEEISGLTIIQYANEHCNESLISRFVLYCNNDLIYEGWELCHVIYFFGMIDRS